MASNYISIEDIRAAFSERDVPADSAGAEKTESIEDAILRAESTANGYLRAAQLTVPLTDTASITEIKGYVLDLWRFYAWNERPSDEIRFRYERSVKYFHAISTGVIRLATSYEESRKVGFRNVRLIRR